LESVTSGNDQEVLPRYGNDLCIICKDTGHGTGKEQQHQENKSSPEQGKVAGVCQSPLDSGVLVVAVILSYEDNHDRTERRNDHQSKHFYARSHTKGGHGFFSESRDNARDDGQRKRCDE